MYALSCDARDKAGRDAPPAKAVLFGGGAEHGAEETAQDALLRAIGAAEGGRIHEALGIAKDVLKAFPEKTEALVLLAHMLAGVGEGEDAVRLLERAVLLKPQGVSLRLRLSAFYRSLNRPDEALLHSLEAVRLTMSRSAAAQTEAARAYVALGDVEEAKRRFLLGIAAEPKDAAAHTGLGEVLLVQGEWQAGWREYAWRSQAGEGCRRFPEPVSPAWNGMRLPHGRVLVIADEGGGDAILLARYLPMVKERVQRVILGYDPEVLGLFGDHACVDAVAADPVKPPAHDAHVRLSSLPTIFQTGVDTVPQPIPYLQAWPERAVLWSARLSQIFRPGALRVGIAWSGEPESLHHEGRSSTLGDLCALFAEDGVDFIALQKVTAPDDRALACRIPHLHDVSLDLEALTDVAAVIANLDLVIAADTPAAHLAGAMGLQTFLLIPKTAHWRWLLDRQDSVWYPCFRLFRQEKAGEWSVPVAEVAKALSQRRLAQPH